MKIVIGVSGVIGVVIVDWLEEQGDMVLCVVCIMMFVLDLIDEVSIKVVVDYVCEVGQLVELVFDVIGFLYGNGYMFECSWCVLDVEYMLLDYWFNMVGLVLLMKYFLFLLQCDLCVVFVILFVWVGLILDNWLGGWYSYCVFKVVLNQMVWICLIELVCKNFEVICVVIYFGMVFSWLLELFFKFGLDVCLFEVVVVEILDVLQVFELADMGNLFDYKGKWVEF